MRVLFHLFTIFFFRFTRILKFSNDYILEVGNLGDTEAAEIEDFNVLEAPPGDHVRKPSIPPWFSDQESS